MYRRHSVLVGWRVFSNLCYLKWYTKSNYVLLFKVNVYHRPNHPIMTEVLLVGCCVLQCFCFKQRWQDGGVRRFTKMNKFKASYPILLKISNPLAYLSIILFCIFSEGVGVRMKNNQIWHVENQEEVDKEHRAKAKRRMERKKGWTGGAGQHTNPAGNSFLMTLHRF